MKNINTRLANTFALTAVIFWVLLGIFVLFLPVFSLQTFNWMTRGMGVSSLGSFRLTFGNFLLGGIMVALSSWILGWIAGWSWEKTGGDK